MKTLTQLINNNQVKNIFVLIIIVFVLSATVTAQYRTYSKVFSDNIKGGTAMFGKTLMHTIVVDTAKMNNIRANGNSVFGNDNANMQFVDIDGNTGASAGTKILPLQILTCQLVILLLNWQGFIGVQELEKANVTLMQIA